jgi:hypothetical protein
MIRNQLQELRVRLEQMEQIALAIQRSTGRMRLTLCLRAGSKCRPAGRAAKKEPPRKGRFNEWPARGGAAQGRRAGQIRTAHLEGQGSKLRPAAALTARFTHASFALAGIAVGSTALLTL